MAERAQSGSQMRLPVQLDGPGAVPIATLIARGESAAERVSKHYADYARSLVPDIVEAGKALLEQTANFAEWTSLYTKVRDLRTSGESARHRGLGEICTSLEFVWTHCDRDDPRLLRVIALHLDALSIAVAPWASESDIQRLHEDLRSAAKILLSGQGYVRP